MRWTGNVLGSRGGRASGRDVAGLAARVARLLGRAGRAVTGQVADLAAAVAGTAAGRAALREAAGSRGRRAGSGNVAGLGMGTEGEMSTRRSRFRALSENVHAPVRTSSKHRHRHHARSHRRPGARCRQPRCDPGRHSCSRSWPGRQSRW